MLRKRCPSCSKPIAMRRIFSRRRWPCESCRAVLRWESPLGFLLFVPFYPALIAFFLGMPFFRKNGPLIAFLGILLLIPAFVITHYLIISICNKLQICPGKYVCSCGYDLTGNTSGTCPECGVKITNGPPTSNVNKPTTLC